MQLDNFMKHEIFIYFIYRNVKINAIRNKKFRTGIRQYDSSVGNFSIRRSD